MLLSLVVHLKRLYLPSELPALGRAIQSFWLDRIGDADPRLAERLHAGSEVRPYTVSDLCRSRDEEGYWFRLTSLTEELTGVLLQRVLPALPAEVQLGGGTFAIVGATHVGSGHPWAGAATYAELIRRHGLGSEMPSWQVRVHFASPTTFRRTAGKVGPFEVRGHHLPLPLPELVFGSWVSRWNAFAPFPLGREVADYAATLALTRYELRTRLLEYGSASRIGFVGECTYLALTHEIYWMRALHLLADFAFYAGTGQGTTMGLGMTRKWQETDDRR